jgi:hypothetical protein
MREVLDSKVFGKSEGCERIECLILMEDGDKRHSTVNTKTTAIIAICTIGLALASGPIASAQSAQTQQRLLGQTAFKPRTGSTNIESAAEASKVPVGTTLLFRCARCGGSQSVTVDETKAQMGWFGDKTKKCPGTCGGWMRYESVRSPAGADHPYTSNTCSRCRKPTISWTVATSTHS